MTNAIIETTATPNHALQRTAPRVTVAAISGLDPSRPGVALSYVRCLLLRSTTQLPRRAPQSLSLGSFGDYMHHLIVIFLVCLCLDTAAGQESGNIAKTEPTITVTVEGRVKKPGTYRLRQPANLLHALAEAGGIESSLVTAVLLIRTTSTGQPETTTIQINRVVVRPPELLDGDHIKIIWTCVAAGSRLVTPEGSRLIETLKIGDSVLGFDVVSKETRFGKIVAIREESSSTLLILNHRLTLTTTHPVWTQKGWVEAGLLRAGVHELMTPQGQRPVTDISFIDTSRPVFDIAVEPTSCFFADDILVHNKW